MRANQSTDVIDLNLAFKLRNLFLNQRRDRLSILAHADCDMMHLPE